MAGIYWFSMPVVNCHIHRYTNRQPVWCVRLSVSSIQSTIQHSLHLIPFGNSLFELIRQGITLADRGIRQLPLQSIHLLLKAV